MNSTSKAENHQHNIEVCPQGARFDSSALVIEFLAAPSFHGEGQISVVSCWNIRAPSICLETKQLQSVNINIWVLLSYEEEREGVSRIYLKG